MKAALILLVFFLYKATTAAGSDSLILYLFLLDDCVICQDYTPLVNQLHKEYGEDVTFIGLFPNFSSKPDKIERFRQTYGISFELKTDYYKTIAAELEATITPEVVLYNVTTGQKLYQGRIDNKFVKLGRRRSVVTEHNLSDALAAAIMNTRRPSPTTTAVGCYINYSDAISKHILK